MAHQILFSKTPLMHGSPAVLIVEDDPLIAMDLEFIVEEAGLEPTCCATVRQALDEVGRHRFAIALLDVDVPDGKTFPVARALMASHVPVFFVSAVRPLDIPAEFAAAPLVPKPYRAADVRQALLSRM
jgi:DNA-binding response OmpR family regulator